MKGIIYLFSCLLTIILFSCKDDNPVNPVTSSKISRIGQLITGGYSYSVYVTTIGSNKYAFLADGSNGLVVINVQNPLNPTTTATVGTTALVNDIFVATINSRTYAFISEGFGGLVVTDISNPQSPVPLDTVPMAGNDYLNTVFVDPSAQIAYLGTGSGNLLLYDISFLPGPPVLRGMDDYPNAIYGICTAGGFAYLAAGADMGVIIENISNPNNPTFVSYFNTTGSAWDVAIGGTYLYVADGLTGVTVLNVSNQFQPQFYKRVNTRGNPVSIYYNTASAQFYIAELADGCEVYAAGGSPPLINQLGFYVNNNSSNGVFFSDPYIYIADGQNGLLILLYSPTP